MVDASDENRGRAASGPPRRPEHPAGQRAGVLAMIEDGLAAHDDVLDALGPLHAAWRAARPIARDLVFLDVDPGEIEDHEVGHHALPHETPVVEAHDARRLEREAADGVLQREE